MRNIEKMIDVKDQIWLTNVKFLWLSLNTSKPLVFCIDTNVCRISKVMA